MAVIQRAYASVHPCGNALSGALMNAGPVIHPPLMIMNAAPLQHFERWDIHNEGTQPVVRAVTDALDQERIAVREALGYGAPHYPLADHYQNDRWMYGDAHRQLVKSGDWREHIDLFTHRYITEDVMLGLALLASTALGGRAGTGGARYFGDGGRVFGARPAPWTPHPGGPGSGQPKPSGGARSA
jgi:opine dehydrogenase